MISLKDLIEEKRSTIPDEEVKERSWVLVFRYNPHLEILLAQDDDGRWSFPGGQLDNEEMPEDAAWRELKEETGITPSKLEFLKTIYHDKPNKLKVSHVFYTEVPRKTTAKSRDDVERSKWFSLDKLPELNDLSRPKAEVVDLASNKIYDAKKEVKENIEIAMEMGLPISRSLITEGKRKKTINGYLVVFEGVDGSGKSSQRRLLKKWLENKGWRVATSKWGTSPKISELLKDGKEKKWLTPTLYSLLNATDMVWRYENEIKPELEKGSVVICDRYYYTSYVRDALRGVDKRLLNSIYENFAEPDLVVHFKVNPRLAVERLMKDKGIKWYSSGMDIGYHENIEECALIYETNMDKEYDKIMKRVKNYRKVNSERSIDEIFKEIKHFIYERVKAVKRIPSQIPISESLSFKTAMRELLEERMSFRDLLRIAEPGRVDRSKHVGTRSMRVTTLNGRETWTFSYKSHGIHSTTGQRWHGHISFFKEDVSSKENVEDLDCHVYCGCPDYFYRYEYNNVQADAATFSSGHNHQPPRPRSEGGVGDYGVGLCVAEGELISTQRGIIPIENVNINDSVWTLDGWKKVTDCGKTGNKQIINIRLKSGKIVKITPEHKVLVFSEPDGFEWIPAVGLKNKKYYVCTTLPANIEAENEYMDIAEYQGDKIYYPSQKIKIDETVAELMGYMISEGSKYGVFSNYDERLKKDFYNKWCKIFGPKSCTIRKCGCYIGSYGEKILEELGMVYGSYNKVIPSWIMKGNRSIIISFLRGCYAGDGNFRNRHSTYASVSELLVRKMQLLLNSIGISCSVRCYKMGVNKSDTWLLRTSSKKETENLYELLNPIRGYSKNNTSKGGSYSYSNFILRNLYRLVRKSIVTSFPECKNKNLVPISHIHEYLEWIKPNYKKRISLVLKRSGLIIKRRSEKTNIMNHMVKISDVYKTFEDHHAKYFLSKLNIPKADMWKVNKNDVIPIIKNLRKIFPEAYEKLKLLERNDVIYDFVENIDMGDVVNVYDLTVDSSEHFTVNGIVVHNCKHLIALADYLKTSIETPSPDDEKPEPREVEPAPEITPETPPTTAAPEPGDDYSDTRSGLEEGVRSNLYNRIETFVKTTPEFDVIYE